MAAAEWILHARKAYLLQKGGHPDEAYKSYQKALDCLKSDQDQELSANLKINMAEMMLRAKNFDAANEMLKSAERYIKSGDVRDSALAMRFWRRQRDLNRALSRFSDSIANQQEVLRISRILFQENSITSLQEEHALMTCFLENGHFDEGYKIASRFKGLLGRKPPSSTKYRCKFWIEEFCVTSRLLAVEQLRHNDFMAAWKILRARRQFVDDLSAILQWSQACQMAEKSKSPAAVAMLKETIGILEKNFPNTDAYRIYAPLAAAHVIPKIYANKMDASVERDMAKIIMACKKCVAPEKRNRDTAWIQYNSLYALVLVHLEKYAEAEKIIDSVEPAPDMFNDDSILNGIYQARIHGLAEHYAGVGDKTNVQKQFDKLRTLLLKMHRIKKESVEKLLDAWGNKERELIEKIDS